MARSSRSDRGGPAPWRDGRRWPERRRCRRASRGPSPGPTATARYSRKAVDHRLQLLVPAGHLPQPALVAHDRRIRQLDQDGLVFAFEARQPIQHVLQSTGEAGGAGAGEGWPGRARGGRRVAGGPERGGGGRRAGGPSEAGGGGRAGEAGAGGPGEAARRRWPAGRSEAAVAGGPERGGGRRPAAGRRAGAGGAGGDRRRPSAGGGRRAGARRRRPAGPAARNVTRS